MGRGEKLYKYNSFDRSINVTFTVAAQSRGEMAGMYQKLNYLASTVTPQYTNKGYMTGNIVKLTMGNYVKDQYGKIDSISLEIPEDSPWLVDRGGLVSGDPTPPQYQLQAVYDLNTIVNELPFIIKVQMKFTPIHDFRPELSTNVLDGGFGDQRYITKKYKDTPETKETKENTSDTGFGRGGVLDQPETKVGAGKVPHLQGTSTPLFTSDSPENQTGAGMTEDYADYGWGDFWDDISLKKLRGKTKTKLSKPKQDLFDYNDNPSKLPPDIT
jgi:hypothetical protein